MFRARQKTSLLGSAFRILELIYHATVRFVRRSHGNAMIGLLRSVMQAVILIGSFYAMMVLTGMHATVRGDIVLFIMTGVFLFTTHTKAMGAVFGAETSTSQMMKHAPMTTAVSISSAALGTLYLQILSASMLLFVYHAAIKPIHVDDWIGALAMLLLSWFTGVAIGVVFLAMRPWAPDVVGLVQQLYARINMIASGKFFLANLLPHNMLMLFSWNPLFHTVDQARGFTFINYNPHFSNWHYPLYVGLAMLMIGLMGEFYTRQHASVSWSAKR